MYVYHNHIWFSSESKMESQLEALLEFYEERETMEQLREQNKRDNHWINTLLSDIRCLKSIIDGSDFKSKLECNYRKAMLSSGLQRNKTMKFISSMDFSDGSMTVHLLDMLSKIDDNEKALQMVSLEMSNFDFEYDVEMYKIKEEIEEIGQVEEEIRTKLKAIENQSKFDTFDLKSLTDLPKYLGSILHPTVYEHCTKIKDYMKQRRIPDEFAGMILKSSCEGLAGKVLDETFALKRNPDQEALKGALIKSFGNVKNILIGLNSEHNTLGKIANRYRDDIEINFKKIVGHCSLIETAKLVLNMSSSSDSLIREYNSKIISYLPDVKQEDIDNREDRTAEEEFSQNIDVFKKLKEAMHTNYMRSMVNQNEKALFANGNMKLEVVRNCPLCKFMERSNFIKIDESFKHLVTENNGKKNVVIESCFFLLNLPTTMKSKFLSHFQFCKVCGYKKIGEHIEKECSFTRKNISTKCSHPTCFLRASFCSDHKKMNAKKLNFTRNLFKKLGVHNYTI